jgi:rhodanese-related sulfurtransferase
MVVKSFVSSACFTGTVVPKVLCPFNLNQRCLFSLTTNTKRCSVGSNNKQKISNFSPKAALRGNLEAIGVPTSVPVRVAHELLQAGHRYLDVRTPEEFSAGHASGAINIPYMYRDGSGMVKNSNFLKEVSAHFGKYDEIIVGCQIGKRSLMASTVLLAAGFTGITDIAGGYAAWTQNGLPTEL